MPPFRTGPIEVDRRFDGNVLRELRDIGHGHRVNIVDASYDIPRGTRVVKFPGSSADALKGIVQLIPVENDRLDIMIPDPVVADESHYLVAHAECRFRAAADKLRDPSGPNINLVAVFHNRYAGQEEGTPTGFYDLANNHGINTLFVRTIDELPFACVSLVAGHSQRTE